MENSNRPNRMVDIGGVQYRLVRVIESTATDLHHIIGKCNQNNYNVRAKENLVRIPRRDHDALNRYFKDKQSPREQLQKIFELTKQVLEEKTRKDLAEILSRTDENFYIPEVLKCKHKQSKKKRLEQRLKK